MRRYVIPGVVLAAGASLVLFLFEAVLFRGEQYGYRDAAHFYYPLYLRVQQEWRAGRLPLWSPEENSGMPLLGNPTAAVLYPGKLIYAALSYPWAARVYPIVHVVIAFAAMYRLLRRWEVSATGAGLGALSYAFGAPVVFQYCNVPFLVGAAWAPLGVLGIDAWMRGGNRWGLVGLSLVLALQTLGGEPQAAYLLGLCAGGYALILHARAWKSPPRAGVVAWAALAVLVLWVAGGLAAEYPLGLGPDPRKPLGPGGLARLHPALGVATWRRLVAAAWVVFGLVLLFRRWRTGRGMLTGRLVGLGAAAGLAVLVIGMQLLPILEFTGQTVRAAEDGSHELFPFSVEAWRLPEFLWPMPFGRPLERNRSWVLALPPAHMWKFWVPSMYCGGLAVVLATGALRLRGTSAPRAWLTAIAVVGVLAAMGEFLSPLWLARNVGPLTDWFGPHDPLLEGEHRRDGHLPDGFGSPYWLMAQVLPGFSGFRYPAKLLTFTCLALAGLAGFGWDEVVAGRRRRYAILSAGLAGLSLVLLGAVGLNRAALIAWWEAQLRALQIIFNTFGPFDGPGAWRDTLLALGHGALVMSLGAGVIGLARGRPRLAGVLAIALLTADLAVADRDLVMTVPQAIFDREPEVLRRIREAEADRPAPGPFRIHRMPLWEPMVWRQEASKDRIRDLVEWEHRTIQPKYGIMYPGVDYVFTEGTAELYDYCFFFAPFYGNHDAALADQLGYPGKKLVYLPRRGFDLWNTRYFVLPTFPMNDERRGFFSLLANTERAYPPEATLRAKGPGEGKPNEWVLREDWQILRNENAFPRAWVVHDARVRPPVRGMNRAGRERTMEEILYQADEIWRNRERVLWNPREVVWIESEDGARLMRYQTRGPTGPGEAVRFVENGPLRVELEATLDRAGFLVLADVYYPGWTLTVDGRPGTILRANRAMRGVALEAGPHRMVFTYEPRSVQVGAAMSLAGLVGLLGAAAWAWRGQRRGAASARPIVRARAAEAAREPEVVTSRRR